MTNGYFPHFSVLDGRLRIHHPRQELDPWLWHAGLAEVSSFTAECGLQLPELCRRVAVNWVSPNLERATIF